MVSNMVFNAIFAYFYGYVGLAIATALSAFVNMALLYRGLHLAGVYHLTKTTLVFSGKLLLAGGAMVAVILWQLESMQQWLEWSFSYRALMLDWLDCTWWLCLYCLCVRFGYPSKTFKSSDRVILISI